MKIAAAENLRRSEVFNATIMLQARRARPFWHVPFAMGRRRVVCHIAPLAIFVFRGQGEVAITLVSYVSVSDPNQCVG